MSPRPRLTRPTRRLATPAFLTRMLATFLLWLPGALLASTAARAQIALSLPEIEVQPGESFAIPIEIGSLGGQSIVGFNFSLEYDPAVIEVIGPERGGTVSNSFGLFTDYLNQSQGRYNFTGANVSPVSGSGVFIRISARSRSEGSTALTLVKSELNRADDTIAQVAVTHGQVVVGTGTSLQAEPSLPDQIRLHPNVPNPFNPSTRLSFDLPAPGQVRLEVFDMLGRRLTVLVDGHLPAGTHSVVFDAASLPSGLYLYRLSTPSGALTRTMHLAK